MNNTPERKLLILNGGYNEVPLIEAGKRFGFHVVTSGNDTSGKGHKLADEYHPTDYSDREAVLKLAESLEIDAICAASNDFAALSAAYTAEKLKLPGHDTYTTSRLFHEKDEFRRVASELGLSVPLSATFSNPDDALSFAQTAHYPLMVKPADLSGGKGISRLDSPQNAAGAIETAFARSKIKRIVLEDFIDGDQYAFICYIKNRRVAYSCTTRDFASPVNPWLVGATFGHIEADQPLRQRIIEDVEKLADHCRMADGFLTIQFMMRDGQQYYLETMRRCLGNLHFLALSKETEVDWPEWFVLSQAGIPCDDYIEKAHNSDTAAGFIISFAAHSGTIRRIDIDERLAQWVFHREQLLRVGDRIEHPDQDKIDILLFSCPSTIRDELLSQRDSLIRIVCE